MSVMTSEHDTRLRRAGHVTWCHQHLVLSWGGVVEHRYNKPKGPNTAPSCGNSFHDPTEHILQNHFWVAWNSIVKGTNNYSYICS